MNKKLIWIVIVIVLIAAAWYVTGSAKWRTYSNPAIGFSIQHPKDWEVETMKDERGGDIVRIFNTKAPGKVDTDVPSEDFTLSTNSDNCIATEWEKGMADSYYKVTCLSGKPVAQIGMKAFNQNSMDQAEKMYSTLTFTK